MSMYIEASPLNTVIYGGTAQPVDMDAVLRRGQQLWWVLKVGGAPITIGSRIRHTQYVRTSLKEISQSTETLTEPGRYVIGVGSLESGRRLALRVARDGRITWVDYAETGLQGAQLEKTLEALRALEHHSENTNE
jgi:hypothetical protein